MDIFERLSQGPGNIQQKDYDDWNQMVGAAPRDRFGQSAYDAIQQVDPDEYRRHVMPGEEGTDPLGALGQGERTGLAQTLLSQLLGTGMDRQQIERGTGLRSLDPGSMSPTDLAQLLSWTRQNDPNAISRTAAEYQDRPDILQSLLGNKALMSAIAGIGGKLLMDQMSKRR